MKNVKLYDFESELDFGQCKGQTMKDVFYKTPSYIDRCFQKIDWFCITDEIFNQLPIIIALRKENNLDNVPEHKNWLKILIDLHNSKKTKMSKSNNYVQKYNRQTDDSDNNCWLEDADGTNDPETMSDVYWNLD